MTSEFTDEPIKPVEPVEPVEPVPEESSGTPVLSSTNDERQMAMFAHIGGIFGFIIPLIIWIMKKDESRFVDDQGKEAVNFHLTMMIGHLIGGFTICFTFGLINLAVWILALVYGIIGGLAANKGEVYRYPLNIRFIK
jgi:uncharacterized Tic20 family protein